MWVPCVRLPMSDDRVVSGGALSWRLVRPKGWEVVREIGQEIYSPGFPDTIW